MLEIENLHAGYDRAERLHGVSARFRPGTLTAIIGPNGCGKTTLLKCAAGLLKPWSGEIRLDGENYARMEPREVARRAAYMPQSRVAPGISVRRLAEHGRYPYLRFGHDLSAEDRRIVSEALRRAGMEDKSASAVSRLSGGERQRAYIAMMLAQEAKLLLLDEPTTYLDPAAQFMVMELLSALAREGRAVAAVLHDLPLAMRYADRVLLMRGGEIALDGTPEELFRSGLLDEVFGIRARKIDDETFVFTKKEDSE